MELLSKQDYLKILHTRFENTEIQFVSSEFLPFSDEVEGFLGEHYQLKITCRILGVEHTESFFIKTRPRDNEAQSEVIKFYHAYEKETFLYNFLLKEFETSGFNTRFAPKCYYCRDTTTIVMENMRDKSYKIRKDYYDLEHCKVGMESLAYFHANSIAYEEITSKRLGEPYKIVDENPEIFIEMASEKDGSADKFICSITECLRVICEEINETDEWKTDCLEKINNLDAIKVFFQELPSRQTLTHGDLWSNNMLFKYTDGIPSHCVLIDFQLMRHHHPAYDVFSLVHQNTRRSFRKQHLTELVQYYYERFQKVLRENGFNPEEILPWDEFLKTGRALEPIALLQAFSSKTLTLLPKEIMIEAAKSKEGMNKLWFTDRSRLVADFLRRDEQYKEIVEEFLHEFYEYF